MAVDPFDDLFNETHTQSVFDDEEDFIEFDADDVLEDVYDDRDVY